MQKLMRGLCRFQSNIFKQRRSFFAELAQGQKPETLFITCSDSRIDPNLLTQTSPGELFVLRNAGNIVPPWGSSAQGGEAATIEYAVSVLGVRDVIICGHSHCGAMAGLVDPTAIASLPAVSAWLEHASKTREAVEQSCGHLVGQDLVAAAVRENVIVQLENLRTYPAVKERLEKGDLTLNGWVYTIETGEVFAYEPRTRLFFPVSDGHDHLSSEAPQPTLRS